MNTIEPSTTEHGRPRRFRRAARLAAGCLAALAAALGLLFLFRAPLASALAPHVLARLGFPESGLRVRAIDRDRILLDEASGVLQLGGHVFRVRLEHVACGFVLRELAGGRLRSVEIGRAEVDGALRGDGDAPDWSPERLARTARELPGMVAALFEAAPLRSLRIDALVLRLNIAGREWGLPPLALDYGGADGKAAPRLSLRAAGEAPLAAEIAAERGGSGLRCAAAVDAAALSWLPEGFAPRLRGRAEAEIRLAAGVSALSLRADRLVGEEGSALAGWAADRLDLALEAHVAESGDIEATPGSRLELAGLVGPDLALERAVLPLSAALRFGESGPVLDWRADEGPRLAKARLAGLRVGEIGITGLDARAEGLTGGGIRLTVTDKARIRIANLAGSGFSFAGLQGPLGLRGEFALREQRLEWRPNNPVTVDGLDTGPVAFLPLALRDARLNLTRDPKAASLALNADIPELGGALSLAWNAKTGDPAQRLTLRAPKKLRLAPKTSPLAVMRGLPALWNNLTIKRGTLGAELRLVWGKSPLAASLDADLTDGALSWKGVGKLAGLELKKARLDLAPRLAMPRAADLRVKSAEGAVPLADIAAKFQLQRGKKGAPLLVLGEARVGLAGGQARARNCRYDFGLGTGDCAIGLHGLDLAAMPGLDRFEGLEVGGRIDGSLPLRLDRTGPAVRDGRLSNAGPGVIRYRPSAEALKNSPYSEIVLKALEDYRYDKLAADVDYRADGTLRIGFRMEGKSPALETSRPVHLNIDSEQNVLSLLKSLQYSRGLTSELDRKVRERYQGKGAKQ